MAQLRPDHPGTKEVARLLRKRVEAAAEVVRHARMSDEQIHEARKNLKKSRAALRLLRHALSAAEYRGLNAQLRDAARPLGLARDARVLRESLEMLADRYGEPAKRSIPQKLRRMLRSQQSEVRRQLMSSREGLRATRALLHKSHTRLKTLKPARGGWAALVPGFQETYGQGRKALKAARASGSAADLHEWRKQIKYLRYQLKMLEPLWPPLIDQWAEHAHQLSNHLGEDHDLFVLRQEIGAQEGLFSAAGDGGALCALIERCRRQLQSRAFALGERLFLEKPAQFAARFGRYWHRWKCDAHSDEQQDAP